MGYTLKIGEAELDWSEDGVRVDCSIVRRDEAPAFGDPTDYESHRWPSYSAWENAMETLGLMDVMFDTRNGGVGEFEFNGVSRYPLLQNHPGCEPITKEHVGYVEQKMREYKAAHPDHIAQYPPPKPNAKPIIGDMYRDEDLVDDPKFDSSLCRGEWLLYWLKWAVENCKKPVFVNS